jgi:three-Cys-motif partner protein
MEKKFDRYYFVDSDSDSLNSLKERLKAHLSKESEYNFIPKDVNEVIKDLSDGLTKQDVALVFLDPFGMQIKWESIKLLQGKKVDLWILVPTGVAINRLLDRKGKLKNIKALETFFGLKEDEIRSHFYKKNTIKTLFGEDEETKKIKDSAKEAALLYCERLTTIWKFVTEEPLVLLNEQKVPIYHLVFASNNETAIKIAKYIIGRK